MDDQPAYPTVGSLDDEELVALYTRERSPMLRVAVLMVGSPETAEEVVHDAFVVVRARWTQLDRPGAYLRTSVVNRCREVIRRREVEHRYTPLLAEEQETYDVPLHLHELRAALLQLSDRQRAVVVLRYLLDLDDDNIAEILGCRPSTVRSLARRGLAVLNEELS